MDKNIYDTSGITTENAEGFEQQMIARHGKVQAPEVVKYMYAPILPPARNSFYASVKCNLAQAVMLCEEKLISKENAAALCAALLEIDEMGPENFPFDPKLGLAFDNYEAVLIRKVGSEIGGRLHIGRSRIDFNTTSARIAIRESLRQLMNKLLEFRKVLVEIADENKDTIMPGYTHMQSAQPTTYAEYLLGVSSALGRDYDRLAFAYSQFNWSPLGSAATAGTNWPLNRERLAQLLGFAGVLENDHDAGQNYDGILNIAACVNTLMNNLNRFITDLYIWSSNEYNLVELDGAFAGTSSIMPQKKNGYPFEVGIGRAGECFGYYTALLSTLVCGSSAFPIMRYAGEPYCGKAMNYAIDVLDMMAPVMKTLILKKDRMEELAGDYFAQSVDLANIITQATDLPFRDSHHIVGRLVKHCNENGLKPKDVTLELIKEIAASIGFTNIDALTAEQVNKAMDVHHFVNSRSYIGGPAAESTARQVKKQQEKLQKDAQALQEEEQRIETCNSELYSKAKELAATYKKN